MSTLYRQANKDLIALVALEINTLLIKGAGACRQPLAENILPGMADFLGKLGKIRRRRHREYRIFAAGNVDCHHAFGNLRLAFYCWAAEIIELAGQGVGVQPAADFGIAGVGQAGIFFPAYRGKILPQPVGSVLQRVNPQRGVRL